MRIKLLGIIAVLSLGAGGTLAYNAWQDAQIENKCLKISAEAEMCFEGKIGEAVKACWDLKFTDGTTIEQCKRDWLASH